MRRLQSDPAFRDHLFLDPILWDEPEAPAAMMATLTPQESVNRGLVRPSECDIVVTILWSRMGTPLERPLKADGRQYLSGTEWEYEDACRGPPPELRESLPEALRDKLPVLVPLPDEKPQHEVELPEFFIARYPVTVAQFRAFIDDRRPGLEDAGRFGGVPNHPVTRVSWHEALAYCDWLTDKLRVWTDAGENVAGWLDRTIRAGWRVTLPSEAEWEKTARGMDGRVYPWGDRFAPDRDNLWETGIGRTSAVGAFPGGASPCGAQDLSGNVMEWTRSLWGPDQQRAQFGYPYRPAEGAREDCAAPDSILRVVRGGSFSGHAWLTRGAFRYCQLPGTGYYLVGVRLAVTRGSVVAAAGPR